MSVDHQYFGDHVSTSHADLRYSCLRPLLLYFCPFLSPSSIPDSPFPLYSSPSPSSTTASSTTQPSRPRCPQCRTSGLLLAPLPPPLLHPLPSQILSQDHPQPRRPQASTVPQSYQSSQKTSKSLPGHPRTAHNQTRPLGAAHGGNALGSCQNPCGTGRTNPTVGKSTTPRAQTSLPAQRQRKAVPVSPDPMTRPDRTRRTTQRMTSWSQ